jgi:hypothetical protein
VQLVAVNAKIIGIANAVDELPGVVRALQAYGESADRLLVVADGGIAAVVPGDIRVRLLSDYAPTEDVQRKAVEWIDDWSDAPVLGDRSFKELLVGKDVSLWWYFLPVLFPDVMRCMQYVDIYKALYLAEAPAVVVCADGIARPMLPFRLNRSFDLQTRVARMVASSLGTQIDVAETSWRSQWKFWSTYLARTATAALFCVFGRRFDRMVRLAIARTAAVAKAKPIGVESRQKKLLLFSTPVYWRREKNAEKAPGGQDVIVGPTVDELVDSLGWQVVDIDVEVNVPSLQHYGRLWSKGRRSQVRCMSLEQWCDRDVRAAAARAAQSFGQLWATLRSHEGFKNSLSYRGVDLWPLLEQRFTYLFREYAQIALLHCEAAERIIETERPDAVLLEYEEGSYGRAAMVGARKFGIPSVALQHGLHGGAYIPSYFFRQTAWEQGGPVDACPIPTKTAVFGEVTRRFLCEDSTYPAEAVAVTGTTIYDDALEYAQRADKGAIKETLGCTGDKVVTVLSSIFTEIQDRRWFIENALTAVADQGLKCVVKLHPREDAETWGRIASQLGFLKPLVLRDGLWQAIAAADVVLSWYSTTVLDALLLHRPVVIMRVPGKNNPESLAGRGGVMIVDGKIELSKALQRLMTDREQCEVLVEQGQRLLEEHIHKCDGRAGARIGSLIDTTADAYGAAANPGNDTDEEFVHGH